MNNISVVFDLDGTLVDTARDLLRVLNEVVAPDGVPAVDAPQLRRLVGYGSKALIQRAYANADMPLTEARCLDVQKAFLEIYAKDISRLSKPYDGVIETLLALKRGGASLTVCTNKPGYLARPLLAELGMTPFFDRIIGGDETPHRKPNAGHIFHAAGHRGIRPIVMVGDGSPDVLSAKAAKVPCILMGYGYCPGPPETLGADVILRNFRDIPFALTELLRPG